MHPFHKTAHNVSLVLMALRLDAVLSRHHRSNSRPGPQQPVYLRGDERLGLEEIADRTRADLEIPTIGAVRTGGALSGGVFNPRCPIVAGSSPRLAR